jgi:putative oxidoreductase
MKNFQLKYIDLSLLLLRLTFGGLLFLNHGWPKVLAFEEKFHSFPDPLGVGSELSYALTIFSEVFCPVLIVLGLFTRYASIPIVITMLVAVFFIHGADPLAKKEMAILYLVPFLILLTSGPGKFSLDARLKV